MRKLSATEEIRLGTLTASNASVALLEITETGLNKSIMDATAPVRRILASSGIHDYGTQKQGTSEKAIVPAKIHGFMAALPTKASLYRPETKQGDPRIWFYGLKEHAKPGDILAIIPHEGTLHLLNLTELDVSGHAATSGHNVANLLSGVLASSSRVSEELLGRLRQIAQTGPLRSIVSAPADTAVGLTLEHALGIKMNSSKAPDYKGIELKAFRKRSGSQQVRKTLFAQVPDWSASKLKSSAEILDAFGYERDGAFKLYCQVVATKRNSQGLMLKVDQDDDYLWENSDDPSYGNFVAWPLKQLRDRLIEKHSETFWVGAKQMIDGGEEYFQFTEVVHTRRPITSQFDILIDQGVISLDHLIKRNARGGAREKGPLFKIAPNSLDLLFPPPKRYDLLTPAA